MALVGASHFLRDEFLLGAHPYSQPLRSVTSCLREGVEILWLQAFAVAIDPLGDGRVCDAAFGGDLALFLPAGGNRLGYAFVSFHGSDIKLAEFKHVSASGWP
ncbi:hypothetical protein D3C78_1605960 [compost metagenome]